MATFEKVRLQPRRLLVEPHRQASPASQGFVVFSPVADTVVLFLGHAPRLRHHHMFTLERPYLCNKAGQDWNYSIEPLLAIRASIYFQSAGYKPSSLDGIGFSEGSFKGRA